jgi:hypothetical protein
MQFHWNSKNHLDQELHKFCIELEFILRPVITRFLIARLERECDGDFSRFHFNIDLNARQITISDKTPAFFRSKISSEFDLEINRNIVSQFFDLNRPASSF